MKVLCKIGGALAALGAVLCIIGGLLGGFHGFSLAGFPFHWSASGQEQRLSLTGEDAAFEHLVVDVDLGHITVESGKEYAVEVTWYGDPDDFTVNVTNGALEVLCQKDFTVSPGVNNGASVSITLPRQAELLSADLCTDLGDIALSELSCSGSLILQTDLGDVELKDVRVDGEAVLSTSLGSVETENSTFLGGLTACSDMGNVLLEGDFACNVDASSDMGNVEFTTSRAESEYICTADTSMGDIYVNGDKRSGTHYESGGHHGDDHHSTETAGVYSLEFNSDMGNIRLSFS